MLTFYPPLSIVKNTIRKFLTILHKNHSKQGGVENHHVKILALHNDLSDRA